MSKSCWDAIASVCRTSPLIPHVPSYLLASMMNVYKFMPNLFCESKKSLLYCTNECVLQLFLQFRLTIQNYTQISEKLFPKIRSLNYEVLHAEQNQTFVNNCHWSTCKHVSVLEGKKWKQFTLLKNNEKQKSLACYWMRRVYFVLSTSISSWMPSSNCLCHSLSILSESVTSLAVCGC